MADWMDELKDSLADDERKMKEAEERQRQVDMQIGFALSQVFAALQKSVEETIPTFNQRLFGGKQVVVFGYENYTITGDHFWITRLPLRFFVKMVSQNQVIECKLKQGSHPDWRWVSVDNGDKDIIITTDGTNVFVSQDLKREAVNGMDQITQKLLSTIVQASGGIKPKTANEFGFRP
jgi:hypothetical protein